MLTFFFQVDQRREFTHFFNVVKWGVRDLNFNIYIYYALSTSTELSLRIHLHQCCFLNKFTSVLLLQQVEFKMPSYRKRAQSEDRNNINYTWVALKCRRWVTVDYECSQFRVSQSRLWMSKDQFSFSIFSWITLGVH